MHALLYSTMPTYWSLTPQPRFRSLQGVKYELTYTGSAAKRGVVRGHVKAEIEYSEPSSRFWEVDELSSLSSASC